MREILFRGFHEYEDGTHKAYYNGKWHTGKWVYGYYGRKGANQTSYKHYICKPVFNSGGFAYNAIFYFEDIEVAPETVCQYTGLKDKNGKKIFENDICNNGSYNDIVIWRNFGYHCDSLAMHDKWLEIVGNKFENPELLEVEE